MPRFDNSLQAIQSTALSAATKAAIVSAGALQTFSLWGWWRPAIVPAAGNFWHLGGFSRADGTRVVSVQYYPSAERYRASMMNSSGVERSSDWIDAGNYIPSVGETILWCVTFAGANFRLFVRRGNGVGVDSGLLQTTSGTYSDIEAANLGTMGSLRAPTGSHFGMFVRSHAATAVDVAAVWDAGSPSATMFLTGGDNMNGIDGLQYAIGIGATGRIQRLNEVATSNSDERTNVGAPIIESIRAYDAGGPTGGGAETPYITYRPCTVTRSKKAGPYHTGWLEEGYQSRAIQRIAPPGTPAANSVGGGVLTARLARNLPSGLIRVGCFTNSRGGYQGLLPFPPNFMSGPMMLRQETFAGVDLVPVDSADFGNGNGFGRADFDNAASLPKRTAEPLRMHANAARRSMTRYAWGRGDSDTSDNGPGDPREIQSGQTFRWLAKPYGLRGIDKTQTTVLHYLRWPLGGNFRYRTARDNQQGEGVAATYGAWTDYIGSSTSVTLAHTVTAGEAASYSAGAKSIVLSGTGLGITPGQMCVRGATYDVANVLSATEAGGSTTVVFDFAFGTAPAEDIVLSFGSWSYAKIEFDLPPVTDAATWRGFEVQVGSETTYGLMTLGAGCWAKNVNGFVYIAHGVGSTTFGNQFNQINITGPTGAASGVRERWLREIADCDLAIVYTNFTGGNYGPMMTYLIGSGAEVIGWGEADYSFPLGSAEHATECDLVRTAAIANGAAYITTYLDMGRPAERIGTGEIYDVPAHQVPEFYARMWEFGLPKLQVVTASIPVPALDEWTQENIAAVVNNTDNLPNRTSTQIANDQLEGENGWDDGPIVVIAANAAAAATQATTAATEIGKVHRSATAIAAGASMRRTKGVATATTLDETLGATP